MRSRRPLSTCAADRVAFACARDVMFAMLDDYMADAAVLDPEVLVALWAPDEDDDDPVSWV